MQRGAYRPTRPGPMRHRCGFTRACANMARRRRVAPCRESEIVVPIAPFWRASSMRSCCKPKRHVTGLPLASPHGCPIMENSTGIVSSCSSASSARHCPSKRDLTKRRPANGRWPNAHSPSAFGSRQPGRDRHTSRHLRRPRSSDHHQPHAGQPMTAAYEIAAASISGKSRSSARNAVPPCALC